MPMQRAGRWSCWRRSSIVSRRGIKWLPFRWKTNGPTDARTHEDGSAGIRVSLSGREATCFRWERSLSLGKRLGRVGDGDFRIAFNVFLTITALVRHSACFQVHVVAHDASAPCCVQTPGMYFRQPDPLEGP